MLNSWKEIASYLDRGVRTVQRWERELQLPVHRIGKGRRSPVYAVTTELNLWLQTTGNSEPRKPRLLPPIERSGKPIEDSHRLLASARALAQTMIENSLVQRQQAEILRMRVAQIRQLQSHLRRAK
jgi:hypothetical protein